MLLAEILRELRNRRTDFFLCLIAGDGPMLEKKLKRKIKEI